MKYDISLLGVYLSSNDISSWSPSLWRFDSTEDALVVGLPGNRGSLGSAMVFDGSGGSWHGRVSLAASDGEPGDGFGFQVAMDDDTVVVTAPFAEERAGAAYVYRSNGDGWVEEQKLMPDDSSADKLFGWSVDVESGVVAIGARGRDSSGVVYLFRRSGSAWAPEQTLDSGQESVDDEFGRALSLEHDELVVGAPSALGGTGAVHVFIRRRRSWEEAQRLAPLEAGGSDFGRHVAHALGPRVLIIGGSRPDASKQSHSVAHLFQRGDGLWRPLGVLTASDSR